MRSEVLTIRTGNQPSVTDLTERAARFVSASLRGTGTSDGLLHVFAPHATAGIAILETGSGSEADLLRALDDLLPADGRWVHRHGSPGHGRDHVMPAFITPFASLPVIDGQIALGTWQSICLVDPNGDNPTRQVRLSFLAGWGLGGCVLSELFRWTCTSVSALSIVGVIVLIVLLDRRD
jgi:secondary thiamine-phosphate synthase enzyme